MKKGTLIKSILIAISILLVPLVMGGVQESFSEDHASADNKQIQNTITVHGTGEVNADPDVAFVRLGLEAEGQSAQKAQEEAAKKMNKILEELKMAGVSEENVQTIRFNVRADYEYTKEHKRELRGYVVTHMIQVKYAQIDQLGELLDQLTGSGANRIDHIQFSMENKQKEELKAIQNAVEHAKAKAETLAKASGKEIGEAIQIVEGGATFNTPQQHYKEMSLASEGSVTSIEAGQVHITKQVTIVFQLK